MYFWCIIFTSWSPDFLSWYG